MATRRFGLSRGETKDQVVEAVGAATAADSMEFTFDLAVGLSREDVILGLEKIKLRIMEIKWPPA